MAVWVWNLHEGERQPWNGQAEFVARPEPLACDWRVGRDGTRDQVIEKYRQWLGALVKKAEKGHELTERERQAWVQLMRCKRKAEAGDLNLICSCKPLRCHADVIRNCLEWMLKRDQKHGKHENPVGASHV